MLLGSMIVAGFLLYALIRIMIGGMSLDDECKRYFKNCEKYGEYEAGRMLHEEQMADLRRRKEKMYRREERLDKIFPFRNWF